MCMHVVQSQACIGASAKRRCPLLGGSKSWTLDSALHAGAADRLHQLQHCQERTPEPLAQMRKSWSLLT